MAKAIKRLLIASVVLLAAGLIFCTVSIAAGVDYKSIHWGKHYSGEVEQIDQTFTEPIKNLKITICSGEFELKKGSSFQLVGKDIPKGTLKSSVENGTLTIRDDVMENSDIHFNLFGFHLGGFNFDKKVTLYVPDNATFELVAFNMAAGSSSLEDLTAKTVSLEMDAGKLDGKEITATDGVTMTMNAGKMDLEGVTFKDSRLEVSAGKLSLEGKLYGDTKATISAGAMDIETELRESDYNFKTDVSAGEVKINGKSYKDDSVSNNAANSFDLSCSAGAIKVKTK